MILRPHHGMCFQFYEGKGYSEEFTDHMGAVMQRLEADPAQLITLQVATDEVCRQCPNNIDGACEDNPKVKRYDEAVLAACGLQDGACITYAHFMETVKNRIIDAKKRENICGDCCWNEICVNHEKEL